MLRLFFLLTNDTQFTYSLVTQSALVKGHIGSIGVVMGDKTLYHQSQDLAIQRKKPDMNQFSGVIAGYDPGGNGKHGVAVASFENGKCHTITVSTEPSTEAVITKLESYSDLKAIGIDTLTVWSTGPSGWRPADTWLRDRYKDVKNSVVSANGLFGSMGLNGMALLYSIRNSLPQISVNETHPKVLYFALTGRRYDYSKRREEMDKYLSECFQCSVSTESDHEWDAAISVVATVRGIDGTWTHDLFQNPLTNEGRLVTPSGKASYWWPE